MAVIVAVLGVAIMTATAATAVAVWGEEGGPLVHGEGAEDGGLPDEGEHALACWWGGGQCGRVGVVYQCGWV